MWFKDNSVVLSPFIILSAAFGSAKQSDIEGKETGQLLAKDLQTLAYIRGNT